MPSSHASVMAFAATTCALIFLHRQRLRRAGAGGQATSPVGGTGGLAAALGRAVEGVQVLSLAALTAAVGYGRVYLGYHSPDQVAAGAALGAACAVVWWQLTAAACRQWGSALLRLAPLRALRLRDTLGFPDVHAAEAAMFGSLKAEHTD
jgi:dolichyldiphosphatase